MFNIFMFFKNCNYVYMLISIISSCHTIAYERKYEYRKPCMHTSAYSKIFKHAYLAVYMHPYMLPYADRAWSTYTTYA